MYAKILGIILLIVGIAGFFMDDVVLWFSVNAVHNWVHILSGVLGIFAGMATGTHARTFNRLFGIVYLLVAILGLAEISYVMTLLNLNAADNYLHLAIGLVTAGVGFFAKNT